ncbi:hypothetical protein SUGI_0110080 [Cryptomeria japonica]|nr:hypothetical protein SUGI_0110080 [Cryptomeria japonica]
MRQCSNGHIACSKCCELLYSKCHSCAKPIGKIRCLAIEKVIESVKVGCKYSCSGCTELVRYPERRDHESKCRYAPYLCPVSGCSFTASSKLFPEHFTTVHGATATQFSYDAWFTVTMDTDEPFLILEGEDMVFLLQNKMKPLGNLIHIIYFGPVSLEEQYSYQIEIKKEKRRLIMESFARSIVGICETLQDFLLVPIETYEENGQFTFEISFHRL